MSMTYRPMARALVVAGYKDFENSYTYQDYLYELCADGHGDKPVSENQWELICDMIGKRKMTYASNIKAALANLESKHEKV